MEVKANWKLVSEIPPFTNEQGDAGEVPQLYHVNTGGTASNMPSVAMHVICKAVPNWTWATFEHKFNPGRCDIIGCRDCIRGADQPGSCLEPDRRPGLSRLRQDAGADGACCPAPTSIRPMSTIA